MTNPVGLLAWGILGFVVAAVMRRLVRRRPPVPGEAVASLRLPRPLEPVVAGLFLALAWRTGELFVLIAYSWLATIGALLAVIDWRIRRLPTKLIWPSCVVLLILLSLAALMNRDASALIRSVEGAFVVLGFYGLLYILCPGQLGGGDLRLGFLLGLALAWTSWTTLLVGTLGGWLFAAISVLLLRCTARRPDSVPLGPFLVCGAFLALLL